MYMVHIAPDIIESVPPDNENALLNLVVSPRHTVSDVILAVGLQATDINLDAVSKQLGD